MDIDFPAVAGAISTVIFIGSAMPMLLKAARSKDLRSYSPGNILLANLGNVVQSFYVFALPIGPIWALHTFYLISAALMLFWYNRYRSRGDRRSSRQARTEDPVDGMLSHPYPWMRAVAGAGPGGGSRLR